MAQTDFVKIAQRHFWMLRNGLNTECPSLLWGGYSVIQLYQYGVSVSVPPMRGLLWPWIDFYFSAFVRPSYEGVTLTLNWNINNSSGPSLLWGGYSNFVYSWRNTAKFVPPMRGLLFFWPRRECCWNPSVPPMRGLLRRRYHEIRWQAVRPSYEGVTLMIHNASTEASGPSFLRGGYSRESVVGENYIQSFPPVRGLLEAGFLSASFFVRQKFHHITIVTKY